MKLIGLAILVGSSLIPQIQSNGYRIETASSDIELEGICSLSDGKVTCWKPSGEASQEATDDCKFGLEKANEISQGSLHVPFNMKTRLFLVRSKLKPTNQFFRYCGGQFELDAKDSTLNYLHNWATPFNPQKPLLHTNWNLSYASFPPSASTCRLRYRISTFELNPIKIPVVGQFAHLKPTLVNVRISA